MASVPVLSTPVPFTKREGKGSFFSGYAPGARAAHGKPPMGSRLCVLTRTIREVSIKPTLPVCYSI